MSNPSNERIAQCYSSSPSAKAIASQPIPCTAERLTALKASILSAVTGFSASAVQRLGDRLLNCQRAPRGPGRREGFFAKLFVRSSEQAIIFTLLIREGRMATCVADRRRCPEQ